MQGTTTSASVYNLAHNPEAEVANTPKYFILEEEGKGSSGDDQSAGGQYFILEEGAADAENEGKKLKASQGAVTMHGAHEYSSLASTGRADNRNDPGAEYTPLSKTSTDKQAAQSANGEGLKKDGQYFILEEGTTEDDDDKGNGGQYFILEEGAANENKGGQQGGQYFILEEGAAAMDDSQDDAAERDYSHLNPADMGDNSTDRNEYTPLGLVAEDPAEKTGHDDE
nr:hypothetical protein BaRGS_006196 [Batillaria attramentaria]